MATNQETAEQVIKVFVKAATTESRIIWTYGDLATAIERPGEHRLLGAALDIVRQLCVERGIPDVATVVVSKTSLLDGTLKPTDSALNKYNGWQGLREEQAKVFQFDWLSLAKEI